MQAPTTSDSAAAFLDRNDEMRDWALAQQDAYGSSGAYLGADLNITLLGVFGAVTDTRVPVRRVCHGHRRARCLHMARALAALGLQALSTFWRSPPMAIRLHDQGKFSNACGEGRPY